jgi:ferritin-like protein
MLPAQYGPAVVGVFRPVLLLPEDFFDKYTPLQRRLILLHEFHHVRRHDLLWLCIARIYRCLFWFNPIAYVAERYIQRDQELSCDEFVLADQENSTRKIYGETLLASLHRQRPLPYAPYLPTFNQIKERTSMLKHHHHQSIHSVLGSFLVFASLFASAAYGLTTAQEQPLVDAQAEFQKDLQAIYQRISNPELTVPQYAQVLHEVEQMESALQADSASDLALAQVANLSGYLCFLMEDFQCAIEKYTVILGLKHGNSALQAATTKTIAQLYFSLENYEQSLLFMDQLEALNGVTPEIMMFKAQTYYQMNNYSPASAYANRAVALAEFNDQIPKENWYQLQISLSTETGDLSAAEAALKKLNDHYPDNKYSAEMR